jgi:hypothetical protein
MAAPFLDEHVVAQVLSALAPAVLELSGTAAATRRSRSGSGHWPDRAWFGWLKRGWVTGRQDTRPPYRWIIIADPAEVARLRALHHQYEEQWLYSVPLMRAHHLTGTSHVITSDTG